MEAIITMLCLPLDFNLSEKAFNSLTAEDLGLYGINSVILAYLAIINASTASVLVRISLLFAKTFTLCF
jgi:hypothetical protein